ncbi:ras-associating and dilute domain-containing protein-like isoform X2 [Watersipora subatra]|uniref:ras-associating and dilute domain-containing protein-like isoform X2 n=1 Tax=Watersipora subatra TaxID=2589382 RepID=UPI00355BA0A0
MALTGCPDKQALVGQVEEYNRRIQLPTFHIKGNFTSADDIEFEGCLRFFLAHAENNFTKAVRLTSSTTWKSLRPSLLEKFNLVDGVDTGKLVPILYAIRESGECSVRDEDCPLILALTCSDHLQFVLRVYQQGVEAPEPPPSHVKSKIQQSNNFFAAMKKKLQKARSKDNLMLSQSHRDGNIKISEPVGPKPAKHGRQKSGDTTSIGSSKQSNSSLRKTATVNMSSLANSSAANARSLENLAQVGRTLKKKKNEGMSSSASNMLAIDDTEEFITIHSDGANLGLSEIAVPIDGSMTVRDVIADVLEECSVSLARVDDYSLCDVIGREVEGIWLTDYTREMNDSEKPLLLISMMKPSEGLSRRFEIKSGAKDTDIASQSASNPEDNLSYEMRAFTRHTSESLSNVSNLTDYNSQALKFPTDCPYLLTIQSYDAQHDSVLHLINNTTSIIGSSEDEDKCSMRLFAPDILGQHCWVCKVYDNENETQYKCISLAPFPGAQVRVNDGEITKKTNIEVGDIVTLGQHYIFIFKDPTSSQKNQDATTLSRDEMTSSMEAKPLLHAEDREWRSVTKTAHSISFSPDKQEQLLTNIFTTCSPVDDCYMLTPAYLLVLALEHSRQTMKQQDLSQLLTKLCLEIQGTILHVTKSLDGQTQEMESLEHMKDQLRSISFWMANCIELRGFLSMNQDSYAARVESLHFLDDVMNQLSDAIVFAFQKAVYHLTKVLYPALDLILTDNPFSRLSNDEPRMNDTLHAMSVILDICDQTMLNKLITEQLFSYLYFFIATSLCNKMLEQESSRPFYNWEEGVKIRKNLELLESWSHDHSMATANNYLSKVVTVADFLATSKQFLLQASWGQLRNLFPMLGAAQLQHLLNNYDMGNREIPAQWSAPPEQFAELTQQGITESFDDHPPLVIPSHSCICFATPIENDNFLAHLESIQSTFGQEHSEDETDSGFELGHSRSPTEADDTGKAFREHIKLGSRSSNASVEATTKSYTPIFRKKSETPPSRRSTTMSKNGVKKTNDVETTLPSEIEHISLASRTSNQCSSSHI